MVHFFTSIGWINDLLSWEAFQPLSKISYLMYLTHISIYQVITQSFTYTFTYSHMIAVLYFFSAFVITVLVSGNWYLFSKWQYLFITEFDTIILVVNRRCFICLCWTAMAKLGKAWSGKTFVSDEWWTTTWSWKISSCESSYQQEHWGRSRKKYLTNL